MTKNQIGGEGGGARDHGCTKRRINDSQEKTNLRAQHTQRKKRGGGNIEAGSTLAKQQQQQHRHQHKNTIKTPEHKHHQNKTRGFPGITGWGKRIASYSDKMGRNLAHSFSKTVRRNEIRLYPAKEFFFKRGRGDHPVFFCGPMVNPKN